MTSNPHRAQLEAHCKAILAIRERLHAEAAKAVHKAAINKPPPVPPLVDQLRDYLATLPPAQKKRISLPAILPHLRGKYREHPHLLNIARAMRQLGYTPVRSWRKDDDARRYWIAPETN